MSFAAEVKVALLKVGATSLQRDVVRELARTPQGALGLAAQLGLRHFVQINGAIGTLGRALRTHLSAHPEGLADGEYEWWHVLATGERGRRGWIWTLRPEVSAAAAEAGWLDASDFTLADEVGPAEGAAEGAVRTITVNRYERDRNLRAACIRHYGARCFVCSIDFGAAYGQQAQGLIHVHHLVPLSETNGVATVDPVRDLRPLCPNCHSVAHRRPTPFSMEELSDMLRLRRIAARRAAKRAAH